MTGNFLSSFPRFYSESIVASTSPVSLVDATAKTLTSLLLEAGEYDVYTLQGLTGGVTTTVTGVQISLSLVDNTTDTTVGRLMSNSYPSFTPFGVTVGRMTNQLGPVRFVLPAGGTVYSIARVNFAVDTCSVHGILRARKIP